MAVWLGLVLCSTTGAAQVKKARVAVFLLPAPGYTPQVVARVSNALQTALSTDPRLEVKDSDKLLVEFSGEIPNERINQAKTTYKDGIEKLRGGKPAEAVPLLEQSVAAYEEVLGFVRKDLLARSWLALGAAQASSPRHARKAYGTFVELLTWRPLLAYDTTLFDAAHLPLFEKARAAVKKLKRGSIELTTDPPGARAYVDGRFMGITPTVVFGLRVGTHYATYKAAGFIKAAQKVIVSGNEERRYALPLARSKDFLLLQQSIDGAKRVLGQPTANAQMAQLKTFLYLDQVIFATMGHASPGRISVQAFLYDLRSKVRLNFVTQTLDLRALQDMSTLARNLYLNIRTDGTLEAPPDAPPPPPPKRRRFYATWWFWSAIVVGGTAIGLAAGLWPSSHECGAACRWAKF
jgi:hypothetical protein